MIPTCAGSGVAPLAAHQRAKSRQSDGVGLPRGRRLLCLGVGHRGVDLGDGQMAGQLLVRDDGEVLHGRVQSFPVHRHTSPVIVSMR
jgi:hypothetical protein